jgi:hypothetical protein
MLKFLKTLSKKDNFLEKGNMYCVLKGTYSGEYFIFLESKNDTHYFLSLPDKIVRQVPTQSFKTGILGGVIDFIERLPKKVLSVIENEYKSINNINGNCNSKENN